MQISHVVGQKGTSCFLSVLTLSPLGPGMPAPPLSPGIPCSPGGPWAPREPGGPMAPCCVPEKTSFNSLQRANVCAQLFFISLHKGQKSKNFFIVFYNISLACRRTPQPSRQPLIRSKPLSGPRKHIFQSLSELSAARPLLHPRHSRTSSLILILSIHSCLTLREGGLKPDKHSAR